MWFFSGSISTAVSLIMYRRTVEVPTEPLLTFFLEVSIHVLVPVGWEQSLRQCMGTSGYRNRLPDSRL